MGGATGITHMNRIFAAQVAIKRITISKASANVKLEVELGEEPGSSEYTLYLMSDSYQAIGG